jgi:hypothetical protein
MMEKHLIDGIKLIYEDEEEQAANQITPTIEKTVGIIHDLWGLSTPEDCRIYIMTSPVKFMFQSAPLAWKLYLFITFPLWFAKTQRLWQFAGGWEQRYGSRHTAGIKPPRLIQSSDQSMGKKIFIQDVESFEKVDMITSHELTHMYTSHLRLPSWLHEGIAMRTVDRFFDMQTVQSETLSQLNPETSEHIGANLNRPNTRDYDVLIYHYILGYWLTRYLEETQSELLKKLLQKRIPYAELERNLADAFDFEVDQFWKIVPEKVYAHFTKTTN